MLFGNGWPESIGSVGMRALDHRVSAVYSMGDFKKAVFHAFMWLEISKVLIVDDTGKHLAVFAFAFHCTSYNFGQSGSVPGKGSQMHTFWARFIFSLDTSVLQGHATAAEKEIKK